MAKQQTGVHWGDWVAARIRALGWKRQGDFAERVGSSENQLSRWVQRSTPPARMRKGFDRTLCSALETTRRILFQDYLSTPPNHQRMIVFGGKDQFFPDDEDPNRFHIYPPENVLNDLVKLMRTGEVSDLVSHAGLLLLAKNDERRAAVENLLMHRARWDLVSKQRVKEMKKRKQRRKKGG